MNEEKYNFTKFKKGKRVRGLSICSTIGNISEDDFRKYERVDIYIDYEKDAIKIIEGTEYKLTRGSSQKYCTFSTRAIVRSGVKIGRYKYVGDNIFELVKLNNNYEEKN